MEARVAENEEVVGLMHGSFVTCQQMGCYKEKKKKRGMRHSLLLARSVGNELNNFRVLTGKPGFHRSGKESCGKKVKP